MSEGSKQEPPRPVGLRVWHFFLMTAIYVAMKAGKIGLMSFGQPVSAHSVLDEIGVLLWSLQLSCFLTVAWEASRGGARLNAIDALVLTPWVYFLQSGVDVTIVIQIMEATGQNFSIHFYYSAALVAAGLLVAAVALRNGSIGLSRLWRWVVLLLVAGGLASLAVSTIDFFGWSRHYETFFAALNKSLQYRGLVAGSLILTAAALQWRKQAWPGALRWLAIATALAVCLMRGVVAYWFGI